MTMRGNKRLIIGLAVGVAVFAAVFGMAATLGGITTDTLGAEDQVVAACDTDGVTTSYDTAYSGTGTAGYKVDSVTLGSLAQACQGLDFEVTLSGGTAQSVSGTLPSTLSVEGTDSYVVEFDETKLAEEVTGVHVVISGP